MNHDRVEATYRSEHPRLWRALYAFTGDRELASDAEAEAFSQVLRRGADVDDVAAWVWTASFKIAGGLLSGRSLAAPQVGVEQSTVTESVAEFIGLLHALSTQQRACIVLRYVGGFTAVEIAGLIGTSPGTVRVQLHRAHHSLRTTLGQDKELR